MAIIRCKIDVSKIDKSRLYRGEKGVYLDLTLLENKGGADKYGNDFMCVQDVGKEARERGEKGPILGNAKFVGMKQDAKPQAAPARKPETTTTTTMKDDGDVPF